MNSLMIQMSEALEVCKVLGHSMEVDHPSLMSSVTRYTCLKCGISVLKCRNHFYGSALEKSCKEVD